MSLFTTGTLLWQFTRHFVWVETNVGVIILLVSYLFCPTVSDTVIPYQDRGLNIPGLSIFDCLYLTVHIWLSIFDCLYLTVYIWLSIFDCPYLPADLTATPAQAKIELHFDIRIHLALVCRSHSGDQYVSCVIRLYKTTVVDPFLTIWMLQW